MWFFATLCAVLFRAEAILLFAVPLLYTMVSMPWLDRLRILLSVYFLPLIFFAGLLGAHMAGQTDLLERFQTTLHQKLYADLFSYLDNLQHLSDEYSEAVLVKYSRDLAMPSLLAGLLLITGVKIFKALSLPYVVALYYGARRANHYTLPREAWHPTALTIFLQLIILVVFTIGMRFLQSRYTFFMCVLLLVPITLYLNSLYLSLRERGKVGRFAIGFTALFALLMIDSFYSFGDKKQYLAEGVTWIKENTPEDSSVLSNHQQFAEATGRFVVWEHTDMFKRNQRRAMKDIKYYDYIALYIKNNPELLELAESNDRLVEVQRYSGRRNALLVIYKTDPKPFVPLRSLDAYIERLKEIYYEQQKQLQHEAEN